jgi:hypothetical protein
VADLVGGKATAFTIFSFSLLLAGGSCLLAWRFAPREEPAAPNPL